MIKHVGRHNNKRIVILFKTVPGEDHMCLVAYPDTLPRHIHDDVMTALESDVGQQSKEFAEYLFRYTMSSGENCLHTLHKEGMIKKVPTNQVIVTPDAKSTIRLDELNGILAKMAMGEEAIKELAELDKGLGMSGKKRRQPEMKDLGELNAPSASRSKPADVDTNISINDVLTDDQLAAQRVAQAQRMIIEANQLLAEAKRLEQEAGQLSGATAKNGKKTKSKKSQTKEA
jgi:hypothetical protein